MTANPKVSVIIPTYNAASTLGDTLKSLESQSYSNLEVIVVDDGSTDESGMIADAFAKDAQRLRVTVVHQANAGAFNARETGIACAEGDLVGFCDAGDIMNEHAVERLTAAMTGDVDIAACAYERRSPQKAAVEMTGFGDSPRQVDADSGWLVSVNTSLWNKLFRTDLLEHRVRLSKPPKIGEDALLLMSLYPYATKMAFVDEPLYCYRVQAGSSMSSLSMAEFEIMKDAWKAVRVLNEQALPSFERITDLAAMVHLGVSAPLVAARTPGQAPSSFAREARKALDAHFPSYRNSSFVSRDYISKYPEMAKVRTMHCAVRFGLMGLGARAYHIAGDKLGLSLGW